MNKLFAFLKGKRTYLTGLGGILVSVLSLAGSGVPGATLSHDAAIQTIVTSLLGIFLRRGIATK